MIQGKPEGILTFRMLSVALLMLLAVLAVAAVESIRCRARVVIGFTRARVGPLFAEDAGEDNNRPAGRRTTRMDKDYYSEDDLKLKGSPAFEVIVPKGINLSLTPAEKKMIELKEAAERQAAEASAESGEAAEKMSDADILKAEMAAMLERMRNPDQTKK